VATINITRGLIGKEDVSYGNGTFTRATSTGGTQSLTKLSTGVEVFNVTDYGALGDGTTDDTTAIQAAVDAAEVSGGTVYFPTGTYVATGLTVTATVLLRGDGETSLIKSITSSTTTILSITGDDVVVERVKLEGNRGQASEARAIDISGATGVRVDGCTILNAGDTAIQVGTSCVDASITNNRIETPGLSGILFTNGAFRCRALGNYVTGANQSDTTGHAGINVLGTNSTAGVVIQGNQVKSSLTNGIRASAVSTVRPLNVVIDGNLVEDCGVGDVTDGEGISVTVIGGVISSNVVRGSNAVGILVWGASENVAVHANVVSNSSQTTSGSHTAIQVHADSDAMRAVSVVGNVTYDDQGTITQNRPIAVTTNGGSITGLTIVANTGDNNTNSDVVDFSPASIRNLAVMYGNVADGAEEFEEVSSFADADTTPSVKGHSFWQAFNSGATSITTLDDGKTGHVVTIKFLNANTTMVSGSGLSLAGAVNKTFNGNDVLTLKYDGTNWLEVSRSEN
jgi:hypothetical protein